MCDFRVDGTFRDGFGGELRRTNFDTFLRNLAMIRSGQIAADAGQKCQAPSHPAL